MKLKKNIMKNKKKNKKNKMNKMKYKLIMKIIMFNCVMIINNKNKQNSNNIHNKFFNKYNTIWIIRKK